MKPNVLSKSFYKFESSYSNELIELNLLQSNAWQIAKFPLFCQIAGQQPVSNHKRSKPLKISLKFFWQLRKVLDFFILIGMLSMLSIKRAGRSKPVLFYTHSADKLARLSDGSFVNFLVDYFISENVVKDYIYLEKSMNGRIPSPSRVKLNFKLDRIYVLNFLLGFFVYSEKRVSPAAHQLEILLKTHFLKEGFTDVHFNSADIKRIFKAFIVEYHASCILLKILRPTILITSEHVGCGLLKASARLKIPSVDLQHGIIDQFHPQYKFASELTIAKDRFVLPSRIGVFGQFHSDVLLQNGFWKIEEIFVLGSSRMDTNRIRSGTQPVTSEATSQSNSHLIVIPTQYTVTEEVFILLQNISLAKEWGVRVILKIHPSESENSLRRYEEYCKQNETFVSIGLQDADIYKMILHSKLVIGFDSAVLLESVSLGVPTITTGIPTSPLGIHEYFPKSKLTEVIKLVDLSAKDDLLSLIKNSIDDHQFYAHWVDETRTWGEKLFDTNYINNCKSLINEYINLP
jgi:hypothetical protein